MPLLDADQIGDKVGTEGHQADHRQGDKLVPTDPDHEPSLGRRREGAGAETGHDENEDRLEKAVDADQQDVGIEDKHERQRRGTDVVQKALDRNNFV